MVSFVREKKWMNDGLSVVRRGPDNASKVSRKWRDHKMSGFGPPEVGTSRQQHSLRWLLDFRVFMALPGCYRVKAHHAPTGDR